MGLEQFKIVLENPHGVYCGGQDLSGKVLINVNSPKKIRGIYIKMKGVAEVKWRERRTQHQRRQGSNNSHQSEYVTYWANEEYFDNQLNVYYGGENNLEPGEYCFPFSYILPYNLPSSYEGTWGHIRYTVKCVIDRPWKFDHECKIAFTVVAHVDLNSFPNLLEPIRSMSSKNFGCCCCVSAPLTGTLSVSRRGAVPGETLPVTMDVENNSNVHIDQVLVKFMKFVTYRAQGRSKVEEIRIYEKAFGSVNPQDSYTWANEPLPIPSLPPSDLRNCGLIDINYQFVGYMVPSGCCRMTLHVRAPMIVGTIPFRTQFSNFSPPPNQIPLPGWGGTFTPTAPSAPMLPSAPILPSAPMDDAPPNYPDLPPPSFEEAVTGGKSLMGEDDSAYIQGDKTYTPRYPVYYYTPPPPPPPQ